MSYKYLSIDFGDSFVGLSVSNGIIPRELPVFKYPNKKYNYLRCHLLKLISDNMIDVIVIGIPFDKDSFFRIKKIFLLIIFEEKFLREKIVWVNEDYSTVEAVKLKSKRRMREDSISASLILIRFLQGINTKIKK